MVDSIAAMHVVMARSKPRRWWQSVAFRSYYAVRRRVRGVALLRFLLNASWLLKRLAWEETWRIYGHDEGFGEDGLRPHIRAVVLGAIAAGDSVVDFGCGLGTVSALVATKAEHVLAIDHHPSAVAATRVRCAAFPNVTVTQGDWSEALIGRERADLGLLLHVLEHIDGPEATLRRLRDHCRRLVIEVPDFSADALNAVRVKLGTAFETDADHVTEFDRALLHDVLGNAGWKVDRLDSVDGCLVVLAT